MSTSHSDYYTLLGVPTNASQDDIKKAFKKLALKHHPDKNLDHQKEEAEEKFKQINEAYQTLSDEQERAAYDRKRAGGGRSRSEMPHFGRNHANHGGSTFKGFDDHFGSRFGTGFKDPFDDDFFKDFKHKTTTSTSSTRTDGFNKDFKVDLQSK